MRWQKTARLAIAGFVIVFAGIVVFTIRQRATTADAAPPLERIDPAAVFENPDGGVYERREKDGKLVLSVKFARQLGYADGRMKLADVVLQLPDRDGRTVEVTSAEADLLAPAGELVGPAEFRGNVRMATSDGTVITTDQATYEDSSGLLKVPGALEFTRGRMKGTGVGATYDQNRSILWLLDQAHITVSPDPSGAGAAEAAAVAIGVARADHYLRFSRDVRITSDGRTIEADDVTVHLREDGETIRQAQLRGNSRIHGGTGAQSMSAHDIDLDYADDGRTLQAARLMENAIVDLPGTGRRVAGRTVDMAMAPDGATLTSLNATENVQVDLPAEGGGPAKRITAASLRATGEGAGLQQATFDGSVEYLETQAARPGVPAAARHARAMRLLIDTKADFGAIERADFRGNFRFSDGAQITAEGPRGLYLVAGDRFELSPSDGDPGPAPSLNDGQFIVAARNIRFSPATHTLDADTDVRSVFRPKSAATGRSGASGRAAAPGATSAGTQLPRLLNQDKPVNVAANRLQYDGASVATYSGSARLWQDTSKIDADTIVLDDSTGNLTARVNVRTTLLLEDVDPTTKRRTVSETVATADTMTYTDATRIAIYTSSGTAPATMKGAQGSMSGDRIELYLKPSANELERAEAHGDVVVQEGERRARGSYLLYTAADDTYVLTGTPVEIIEKEQQTCKRALGTTLKFQRGVDSVLDSERFPTKWTPVSCPAELRF